MAKEVFEVGMISMAFTCSLLGLRQLICRGRKCSRTFAVPVMRERAERCSDEPACDLPSEAPLTEESDSAPKVLTFAGRRESRAGVLNAALALLFACASFDAVRAQQTIFNVPS